MSEKEKLTKKKPEPSRGKSATMEFPDSSFAIAPAPDLASEKTWIWRLSKTEQSAMRQVDPKMLFGRTENENKISKYYTVSGLRLINKYQQLAYNKIYLNNP
jgi:hypothetical protein